MANSLEYNCEQALLLLLEANPALAATMPRHSEYYDDSEPSEEEQGNLKNPNLSVQCSKTGVAVIQTVYFKVDCEIHLWIEADEETEKQGIDGLFHQIESIFDDPFLHQTIMQDRINRAVMDCEFSRNKSTQRNAGTGRYERIYKMELIAAAKA